MYSPILKKLGLTPKTAKELSSIVSSTINHFMDFRGHPQLVDSSIPILFFGDIEAYQRSKRRVITVALNPSDKEFAEARFETHAGIMSDYDKYIATLSKYFESNPYQFWFNHFEKLLQTIGASYYSEASRPNFPSIVTSVATPNNRALHTDVCSPIATRTTWSKLKSRDDLAFKQELQKAGAEIWLELVDYLEPDIILISGGKYLCDYIPEVWGDLDLPDNFDPTHQLRTCQLGTARVFWLSGKNVPVSFKDAQLQKVWEIMKSG
jgi:hypothetical protein